ncbi:MAG: hypothetical protein WBM64_04225 [Woeseiaceae bacterium]
MAINESFMVPSSCLAPLSDAGLILRLRHAAILKDPTVRIPRAFLRQSTRFASGSNYRGTSVEGEIWKVVARGGMERWLRQLALRASVGPASLG